MSLNIIIDGYNLIRQSSFLSSLDRKDIGLGRNALIDMLAAYKKIKPHRIIVVFDGANAPMFSSERDRIKGIDIRYSKYPDSADTVIKKMVTVHREKALIVSSDMDIIKYAESKGVATISSPLFETKIKVASDFNNMDDSEVEERKWQPTTKKKGPGRKLSKKKRRNIIKSNKL
ncbi:MAG: NYN domain-containing protein [Pseudomonadota bacterium]